MSAAIRHGAPIRGAGAPPLRDLPVHANPAHVKPTVLLFDIDGTLVTTGGAGRRALERGFEVVFGRADACTHFPFDGMTDRAIIREGLGQSEKRSARRRWTG